MTLRTSDNSPDSQPGEESSRTPLNLGFVEVHTVDRTNLPARLGPWPLKRNQSSCSTVVASSSSHSNSTTGNSGELTRVATPNAENESDGLRRRKSELTETMETVDRQCKAIQELLEAENAALRTNIEEAGHTERHLREEQQQSRGVAGQSQQNVDVERGAAALPGGQHCQNCQRLDKEGTRVVDNGVWILVVSMLGFLASPYIWQIYFGREQTWKEMTAQQQKEGILVVLIAPTLAYALALAVAEWNMVMVYEKPLERRGALWWWTSLVSLWTIGSYMYCSGLLSKMMEE